MLFIIYNLVLLDSFLFHIPVEVHMVKAELYVMDIHKHFTQL